MSGLSKASLQRVVTALEGLYPLKYANHTWDNTGLLVDSSNENSTSTTANIMLTIDLTESVADEAIANNINIIVAYHPFLFRKFNKITPDNNSQHRSLIKLIQNNISVYSPHTAVDAAIGGVNDWLAKGIINEGITTEVIEKDATNDNIGMGRIVTLANPLSLMDIVNNIKKSLGIEYLQLITPNKDTLVKKIALCAGSGSGVFDNIKDNESIDLYYTGELSHHEQLAYLTNNKSVILCGHSNTERGYLKVMKELLSSKIDGTVIISEKDSSPFITV